MAPPYNASSPQTTPTYDGSGQAVHPDLVYIPEGFAGYTHWLAFTPYPSSNDDYENPSILASNDGDTWEVPAGLTNPIEPAPTNPEFNSDVDLCLVDGTFYLFWRHQIPSPTRITTIYVRTSTDGVTWSAKQQVLQSTEETLTSPTFVHDGETWLMWYVDSGVNPGEFPKQLMRRESSDLATWSEPVDVTPAPLPSGREPWHIDVHAHADGLLMFLHTCTLGQAGQLAKLHFAWSTDAGVTWEPTYHWVMDAAPTGTWDGGSVYRSTGYIDEAADVVHVWYSAFNNTAWRVGRTQIPTHEIPGWPGFD